MGEMRIPAGLLYGASTQRAVENFPISGLRFDRDFIRALAVVKACCAEVNGELGLLDQPVAQAIKDASEEVASGKYDEHFVVDVFQTGSGTSTNMNFNEVAANIANRSLGFEIGSKKPVHPNDHVNKGQSSNDVIPTAIHVATAVSLSEKLIPALASLEESLRTKAVQFQSIVKIGRTHLQDATPLTLGQEFSGYAAQMRKAVERLERVQPSLCEIALGGTAVGTGMNTHREFGKRVAKRLSVRLKLPFCEATNHFEAQASKDACVETSGALKTVAVSLAKIANDVRWLSSGPRGGLCEIKIPETQPGSSIMPGKVNPVIAEALLQACAEVIGSDATVTQAGLGGNFELNTMMPLIGYHLLLSIRCLANAVRLFDKRCIRDIECDTDRLAQTLEQSLMLVTALVPSIGYDKAAEIAKEAFEQKKTIREVAVSKLRISQEELSKILDPKRMLYPDGGRS